MASAYTNVPWSPLRQRLADAEPATIAALIRATCDYHDAVLAPDWTRLRAASQAHALQRSRQLTRYGPEQLLDSLHPGIRWRPPVLEVDSVRESDLDNGGRGLVLVPWGLAGDQCRPQLAADGPLVLLYPIATPPLTDATEGDPLGDLLGSTRAGVLRQLLASGPNTTKDIATRPGVSPASASEHATVLRAAGLVETVRQGRAVHHRLTPRGPALLVP